MLCELHITTAPTVDVSRWAALCRALGIKPLVIELERGEHPRQVMMAARHEGDDRTVDNWSGGLVEAFTAAGFPVLRQKLEVPLDKAAPYAAPAYHEAHVKMLLTPRQARNIPGVAAGVGMHASRNSLATTADGLQKWYLTSRAYGVDYRAAGDHFGDVFMALHEHLPSVRMEMETVLHDTHPALDKGWTTT